MLYTITVPMMEALMQKDTPYVSSETLHRQAEGYVAALDERLDAPLAQYVQSGRRMDWRYGEFSLLAIQALCRCSYFQAVLMMDRYLKDPRDGKAYILRR